MGYDIPGRDAALAALRAAVDADGWIEDSAAMAPYLQDQRRQFAGAALAVLRPASVEQVTAVVRTARDARVAIVPQGGNTGLVGGSAPRSGERAIVLSLQRLKRVREIDPDNFSVVVEAGCRLSELQAELAAQQRWFPLALGSGDAATVGGVLATNAGGTLTPRYGNTRELVLGLEVVLADGRVWHGLRTLRKCNLGYDLKQLFIGAEGTLGVITAAALKLQPRPRQVETAFIAVPDPAAAVALHARLREATGDAIAALELLPRIGLDFALRHAAGTRDPFAAPHPWYVLAEATTTLAGGILRESLETALTAALECGLAREAVLAQSERERQAFWSLRESLVHAQRHEGGSIKHDISVPVGCVAEFIERASRAVLAVLPGIRPVPFGHLGDGNLHFNLSQPVGADAAEYLGRRGEFNRIVHEVVRSLGGSISAEHGIGRAKAAELARVMEPIELELMRRLKAALDPDNLMNPAVLLQPWEERS